MKNNNRFIFIIPAILFVFGGCTKSYRCLYDNTYSLSNTTDKTIVLEYVSYSGGLIFDQTFANIFLTLDDTVLSANISQPYATGKTSVALVKNIGTRLRINLSPKDTVGASFIYSEHYRDELLSSCNAYSARFRYRTVYNLTDTTSIVCGGEHAAHNASPFDQYVKTEYTQSEADGTARYRYVFDVRINDSMLALMEKDTSMLRLFPEYYGTAR